MVLRPVTEIKTVGDLASRIISEIQEKYPSARCLLNDEVYGDEDLDIDIFIKEERLLELDGFANELTFRYWEQTGYDILPMVAPIECYPIRE